MPHTSSDLEMVVSDAPKRVVVAGVRETDTKVNGGYAPLLLIIAGVVTCFLFCHERFVTANDPANFVLALKYGYSIADQRPHEPGYPGFYVLWKVAEGVTGLRPHLVILLCNLVFSCGALLLTWFATRQYLSYIRVAAILLLVTNPMFLYFTNVAELYAFDAAFSALLLVLFVSPPRKYWLLLYVLYGLLGGFRLSSVILTAPVIAVHLVLQWRSRKMTGKQVMQSVFAVTAGTLLWLVPFVIYLGGMAEFRSVVLGAANLHSTVLQTLSTFSVYVLWMFNVFLVLLVLRWHRVTAALRAGSADLIRQLLMIVIPGLFFAIKYYAKGYALIYIAPLAVLEAKLLNTFNGRNAVLGLAAVAQLVLFFLVPFISAPTRSAVKHEPTAVDRVLAAGLRGSSYFAPTYSHILHSDQGMQDALFLISKHGRVFVDNSAALWAYPRSLQACAPSKEFLMPDNVDSSVMHLFTAGTHDPAARWPASADAPFVYLADRNIRSIGGPPPATVLEEQGALCIYDVPIDSIEAFHSYITRLYFRPVNY